MRWFLMFNPFACVKLVLLAVCVLTLGLLLAVNVLRVDIDNALRSRHQIASDPEHVYSPPSHRPSATHTNESPGSRGRGLVTFLPGESLVTA